MVIHVLMVFVLVVVHWKYRLMVQWNHWLMVHWIVVHRLSNWNEWLVWILSVGFIGESISIMVSIIVQGLNNERVVLVIVRIVFYVVVLVVMWVIAMLIIICSML